jgi:hypothetical protein
VRSPNGLGLGPAPMIGVVGPKGRGNFVTPQPSYLPGISAQCAILLEFQDGLDLTAFQQLYWVAGIDYQGGGHQMRS